MSEMTITAIHARELTDRIKVGVEAIWELVKQAYQSRAWAALGYDSWDDYCTREFGTSRIRLPREERQEVVSSMREIGMSNRAIATATGTSESTVRRIPRASNDAPAPVTGTDGKTYTPKPRDPEPEETPMPRWDDVGTVPPSKLKNIQPAPGITSKEVDELNQPPTEQPTMEQPEDKPRAEPITNRFTSAVVDLNRVMAKFDRLANDPNFPRNKEKVAALHRHDLTRSISELQALADQLN